LKKYHYIDKLGNTVISNIAAESANPFQGGLASIYSKGKIGYIDRQGNWVWPMQG
jgi:hypothetical protein